MKSIHPSIYVVAGIVYFLFPLDGDFAFPIGYLDDVVVMVLSYRKYAAEMKQRRASGGPEQQRPSVAPTAKRLVNASKN